MPPVSRELPGSSYLMKLTGLTYQLVRDELFSLHRAGCRDIAKNQAANFAVVMFEDQEFASIADALDEIIDDEMIEMGYDQTAVKVYPCVTV